MCIRDSPRAELLQGAHDGTALRASGVSELRRSQGQHTGRIGGAQLGCGGSARAPPHRTPRGSRGRRVAAGCGQRALSARLSGRSGRALRGSPRSRSM
eukprot:5145267-Alexandrium_andersonii.AAC.1